jgi:mRNA interferase HicA
VNANQFRRYLAKHGCKFESHRGGSGHLTVLRGKRRSQLPMHGGNKELGRKLVAKILKDLEIE